MDRSADVMPARVDTQRPGEVTDQRRGRASRVSRPTLRDASHPLLRLWRNARGPMAALVVVAALSIGSRDGMTVPDLSAVFLLIVVFTATLDGSRAALVSGLIFAAYVAYSTVGAGADQSRGPLLHPALFSVSAIAAALIAGAPRRRAEVLRRSLRLQRQRLTEALRSKNEFMDAAAHELRTPLTVISGYASMIQEETFGRLPERFRDPVAAMQRKARELNALIDEMLLAARVQQGTAPTATISLDVRDAVRQAVERAAPRVTLAQAVLSYEVPATPVLCHIDPDHLGHILDSLITNALTYSEERPSVKITVTGGNDTRILVKDRGYGVPESMREKIFERFVHYANPEFQPKSGRGLGLAVSRELAERYGGSLDLVRSEAGKGSLFVLRLPGAPA